MLVVAALCLTPGAARAQSLDIPLNFDLEIPVDGPTLTINVGIDGQAPRPYLFDTGSQIFVANYTQAAFGSVPSSMNGRATGLQEIYADGVTFNYNIVASP